MFIDWTYVVLVLPAVIFSIWCSARVQSTFKKYSAVPTRRGVTGADAARRVLDANGLTDVRIERVAGNLTDHYDPRTNVIRLSESVYGSATAAAVGVAGARGRPRRAARAGVFSHQAAQRHHPDYQHRLAACDAALPHRPHPVLLCRAVCVDRLRGRDLLRALPAVPACHAADGIQRLVPRARRHPGDKPAGTRRRRRRAKRCFPPPR